MRCFIAVEIGEKKIIDGIMELQKAFVDAGTDLKLVETANIHITLRFLGETSKDIVEKVYQEMEKAEFKPFEAELKGVGAFPNLNRINVIWIGIQKGANELNSIFSQLEPRLRKIGFQPDDRGFSPHITIARVRSGRNKEKLANIISEAKNRDFGIIRVESIKLKKSVLMTEGPIYSTLYEAMATKD